MTGKVNREQFEKIVHLPSLDLLGSFYNWGDNIIKSEGNDGYDSIKELVILEKIETLTPFAIGITQ